MTVLKRASPTRTQFEKHCQQQGRSAQRQQKQISSILKRKLSLMDFREGGASAREYYLTFNTIQVTNTMNSLEKGPSCFMHWCVQKVTSSLYSVSATTNGVHYDHVGNFRSVSEAHSAGRRYAATQSHHQQRCAQLSSKVLDIQTDRQPSSNLAYIE